MTYQPHREHLAEAARLCAEAAEMDVDALELAEALIRARRAYDRGEGVVRNLALSRSKGDR